MEHYSRISAIREDLNSGRVTCAALVDYYLKNVGNTQQDVADYHMAQNRYCHYQKQNPHVIKSMVAMGVDEVKMRRFVNKILFPEID